MTSRPNLRDLRASFLAAAATLVTLLLNGPEPQLEQPTSTLDEHHAMQGLLNAEQAQTEGAWLLDEPGASARLSFAPQYDRLVWRVEGGDADVLLDAQTGEALEFTFD